MKCRQTASACLLLLLLVVPTAAAERPDILVADFEGPTYGDWKTTGTAFGTGPARGTLPNQMEVSGFLGHGLVNSFRGGDATTGTLTSPPLVLRRRYLNFLIGGGGYPGKTCVNLLQGGKVVRTATGPNDQPGGSEALAWHTWDVADLQDRRVVIQIVDDRTEGWGHINVDHIVQSDRPRVQSNPSRTLTVSKRYLHLPVKNGAPKRRLRFLDGDKAVRDFEIELANGKPDFWVFSDVSAFHGRRLTLTTAVLPAESKGLDSIVESDEVPGADGLYREKLRPQFHFTSRRGWLNDPNGLVFFEGEYHLFYQHNAFGHEWGNMHWGHATSPDLVHWRELPIALYPRRFGDWAFSGSAVVDERNTSGLGKGGKPPLVAAYTSTDRGECIVFSTDRGRTWQEISENPVVRHQGRDPRLLWHAPSKRWVMAVYDEYQGKQWIAFYSSSDLKRWQLQSRIEGFFECPELFEIPLEGEKGATRWVLYAADGKYLLGHFDGKAFTRESGKHELWHGNFYASQTFSNATDGRRIQIGWGRDITFPGMPFNQQMTFPCRLTLCRTDAGPRLFAEPVEEIRKLHGKRHRWQGQAPTADNKLPADIRGDLFDIRAEVEPKEARAVEIRVGGVPVVYDAARQEVSCKGVTAPLKPRDGKVRLRLLVDRGSVEVFGNDGAVALSVGVIPPGSPQPVELFVRGAGGRQSVEVIELGSAWR
jgi:fructan beta-fructosidase